MSQIVDELRAVAQQIENETQVGGNTAARVGGAFEKVADCLGGTQQIADLDAAVANVQAQAQQSEQDIQDLVNALPVTQTKGQSTTSVMSQKAVTDELDLVDNGNEYIGLDVRYLAVGQPYKAKENVKTSDGEFVRLTKDVVVMNTTDVVATGDLKSYNGKTYKALKAISAYDGNVVYNSGDYAVVRPSVSTISVDVSALAQNGNIDIVIGGVSATIPVTTTDTAINIAAYIVNALNNGLDGWDVTDNLDGTITINCLTAGANTLSFRYTDTDSTGVVVSANNVAGATTTSVFDGTSWSAATLAIMSADATLYQEIPIATLISTYTTQNSLRQDVFGTKTEEYPEFIKYGAININSTTKLASDSMYVSALYKLRAGQIYTFDQYIASVVNGQKAVAILASEAEYKNGGNIKRFISNANKDSLIKGVTYKADVDEYLVLVGRSTLRQTWFKAICNTCPDDRLTSMEIDINTLKGDMYNGVVTYKAVTPVKSMPGTGVYYGGVCSETSCITYLYRLEKGKTYNIYSCGYNGAYAAYSGVFELKSDANYVAGGGGVKKQWTADSISKTFKCLEDMWIVTGGFRGNTTSQVLAMYIVREVVGVNQLKLADTIVYSAGLTELNSRNNVSLSAGGYMGGGGKDDIVKSYQLYAGETYRISQLASTHNVLATLYTSSAVPANKTKLGEIIAVGYPSATNLTTTDYTPTQDCVILVQTKIKDVDVASISKIQLQNTITYLKNSTERRIVQRTDMTDVVVTGSSQTEADYQPKGFAWLERLNDILDLNFHNDGWSGYSFNENIVNMTTLTGNAPEYLGPRGVYTYKHRQISAKYYLFNNSANGTPYGAKAYTLLHKAVEIAQSFGAKVLFANEAARGDDKIAYTRRAFCHENHIPYVSVLEEVKRCYPLQALFPSGQTAPSGKMPYGGWFVNQHLAYRSFSVYRRYIEMLERIPIWKSVKLFKVRPMYKNGSPTAAELAYDNNYQRLRFFYAIGCGCSSGINTAQMDNLDNTSYAVAGGDNTGNRTNENAALKIGSAVSFNKFAAVEFILERVKITKGTFKIQINTTPTNVYVAIMDVVSSNMGYRTRWMPVPFTREGGGLLVADVNRTYPDIQLEDKVRFLIECSGGFTLASPQFLDYNGKLKQYREESIEGYHERLYGTELNPQTGFPTSGHGWTLTGNASVVALPSQIANYTSYNNHNSHLQLDDNSASATKTFSIAAGTSQVAIRVVCCTYPKIATTRFNSGGAVPAALQPYVANDAPQVRTYEYDYGTMVLQVNDSAIRKAVMWQGWSEIYFEVDVPPTATSIKLYLGREFFTEATYNVNSWKMLVHDVSVQKIR